MLVDTHCHLNLQHYQDDLDIVVQRAMESGIGRILVPGTDLQTSQKAIDISDLYPMVYAAVGFHPNEARSWNSETIHILRELAQHPKVVAIGEIGLDYYRDYSTPKEQDAILQEQLALASEINKPVILHGRNAFNALIASVEIWLKQLQEFHSPLQNRPGVFHSFEGDEIQALRAIESSFLIGVAGPVTFKNARQTQQIVRALPIKSIILETDAPYLAPHPHRGTRNEPGYLTSIASKVAELRNTDLVNIEASTTANANLLFSWSMTV